MSLNTLVLDLSHWNSVYNVSDIVRSGIVGVIYKASEGSSYKDDTYPRAKQEAGDHGLLFGAYHFLRPGDMTQQAKHFVETAGDIDLYAADHEDEKVSLNDLKSFLYTVRNLTEKSPIIYSGHVLKNQMNSNVYDAELSQYRLWLAQYTAGSPSWPNATWPKWWLWQYTDTGTVEGINGAVDLNYYDGSAKQLANEWMGVEGDDETEIVIKITVPHGVKVVIEEE